jgi:thioredoxin reductase
MGAELFVRAEPDVNSLWCSLADHPADAELVERHKEVRGGLARGQRLARNEDGFVLTGAAAGAEHLLETSVPEIFASGDARSGSTKRCATAVGEGAMAVQFVHERLGAVTPVTGGA